MSDDSKTSRWAPWQERVFEEYAQLSERLTKLSAFLSIHNPKLRSMPEKDAQLLWAQADCMQQYLSLLVQRISRF